LTRNLYALLGVAPDANAETIGLACARLIEAETDHNARVLLRHAREVLCNPVSRAAYDTKLREEKSAAPGLVLPPLPLATEKPVIDFRYARLVALGVVALLALGIGWMMLKKARPVPSPMKPAPRAVVIEQTRTEIAAPSQAPAPDVMVAAASPEALYAAAAPSVIVVESLNAQGQTYSRGSGVVIGPQRVITNCHVIDRAVTVKVKSGSSEYTATSGTSDTYFDLCLLQVENLPAPEVRRGSAQNLQVGQTVYAIGAPQGLDRTLSQGLISALRDTPDGAVIQTSAPISPGSSGGGLFDAEGRLIGITTFQTKYGQNLNFALPVDWLESMRTR